MEMNREEHRMYDRDTRLRAMELFLEHHNVTKVAEIMDGPSRSCIESWVMGGLGRTRAKSRTKNVTVDDKLDAIRRVRGGESVLAVAEDIDVSFGAVYHWIDRYEELGAIGLMSKKNLRPEPEPEPTPEPGPASSGEPTGAAETDELEALRRKCADLQFEVDLMKGVIDIVKKDRGADLEDLSNKEKTILIDALRPMYSLTFLVSKLGIAPSSYHHSHSRLSAPDKYADERAAVIEEFEAIDRARGYRYVCQQLKKRDDVASIGEKKVRQIMREEELRVVYDEKRMRKYNSYKGEISEAPDNLVNRCFHADAPNRLWLTDITEFKLPDDTRKVYLSPVIDCFDGAVVSWSTGLSPNAELANGSLLDACAGLGADERPVCHSDRGCHYRWPGWISICEEFGITRSMSKKGCSPDNSACEGFFGRLKNEFFYHRDWSGVSAEEFMERLDAWLCYYNEKRIKQSLGWMSPMQYRRARGMAA